MLTIYVSPRNQEITTVDGSKMTVKGTYVREVSGFISLQDLKPSSDLNDVEIVLMSRFFQKKLNLKENIKKAVLLFLQNYHAKQDISFDCYAFANLVRGVKLHEVPYMLKFWNISSVPLRKRAGSVIFLISDERFHHAAIYIGSGLYISVWGAGGDLEITTLSSMKRDFKAEKVVLAEPIYNTESQ